MVYLKLAMKIDRSQLKPSEKRIGVWVVIVGDAVAAVYYERQFFERASQHIYHLSLASSS